MEVRNAELAPAQRPPDVDQSLRADEAEVQRLFDASDRDASGIVDKAEFEKIVEGVAHLREGRVRDGEKLAAAAKVLHAQALADPLSLVAEGEVPTLLRCAATLSDADGAE